MDVEAALRRVVNEFFGAEVDATYSIEPKHAQVQRVRLRANVGDDLREAGLRASQEWFEVRIFDLDVSATIYEYDDDSEKEQALAHLARLAQAYMRGQGQIHSKRRAWRGRPLLTIEVDGRRWELGRRSSRVKYL